MSESQENPNKPVSLRCRLNYPDVDTFIRKYASHVSKTVIFAKIKKTFSVGAHVKFEFSLTDGTELLKGLGQILSSRSEPTEKGPAGIEIRILKLDKTGKQLIERIDNYKHETEHRNSLSRDSAPTIEPEQVNISTKDKDVIAMTDHTKKSVAKIDLDAVDSLLDQIAAESHTKPTKKKRIKPKKIETASDNQSHTISTTSYEENLHKSEEEIQPVISSQSHNALSDVIDYKDEITKTEELTESVANEEKEYAEQQTAKVTAIAIEEQVATVENIQHDDKSSAIEADDIPEDTKPDFLAMTVPAEPPFESVLKEDTDSDIIELSDPVRHASFSDNTEITLFSDTPSPIEEEELSNDNELLQPADELLNAVVSNDLDDAVLELGPESETFSDVEEAKEVSVKSVLPKPATIESLTSSIPPIPLSPSVTPENQQSSTSAPPPIFNSQSTENPQKYMPVTTEQKPIYNSNLSAPIYGSNTSAPIYGSSYPPPNPRAPIYGTSYPPPDPRAPIYGTSYPPAPAMQPIYSSSPPPAPAMQPIYSSPPPPAPAMQPIYSSPPPPAPAMQPIYPSSPPPSPAMQPIYPSSPPISTVLQPPVTDQSMPIRASQAPVVSMAQEELSGILGSESFEESELVHGNIIQEDELDALLNALEDEGAAKNKQVSSDDTEAIEEIEDIEEINEIDDLEVIEID